MIEKAYWLNAGTAWKLGQPEADGWVWPSQLPSGIIDEVRSLNYYRPDLIHRPPNPPLALLHLDRLELRTPYPEVVGRIDTTIRTPPLRLDRTPLIVDATGVGLPVVEMMRQAGLGPTACTITSDFNVTIDPYDGGYRVPKRDLISTMSVLLEQRRLKIPTTLPNSAMLVKELQEFKRTVTKVGNDSYAAERDRHDDMVLTIALACWYREYQSALIERENARLQKVAAAEAERDERANRLAIANARRAR